jgi:hypothetical protein
MASRTKKQPPPDDEQVGPLPLRPGMPVRLLPYDWPFLYSVVPNGDLVINKRLPAPAPPKRSRKQVLKDLGDAPM